MARQRNALSGTRVGARCRDVLWALRIALRQRFLERLTRRFGAELRLEGVIAFTSQRLLVASGGKKQRHALSQTREPRHELVITIRRSTVRQAQGTDDLAARAKRQTHEGRRTDALQCVASFVGRAVDVLDESLAALDDRSGQRLLQRLLDPGRALAPGRNRRGTQNDDLACGIPELDGRHRVAARGGDFLHHELERRVQLLGGRRQLGDALRSFQAAPVR